MATVGQHYRLKSQIGEVGNGALEAGWVGTVAEIVPAGVSGAGPEDAETVVLEFANQGRRWSCDEATLAADFEEV